MPNKRLLNTRETAALVGVSVRTLEDWRYRDEGQGPPFIVVSPRCVRYDLAEVEAWIAARPRVIQRKRKSGRVLEGQLSLGCFGGTVKRSSLPRQRLKAVPSYAVGVPKEKPSGKPPAPPPVRPCYWKRGEKEGNC